MTSVDGAATVGRYTIVRELGEGGMATVYLARQRDLDRLVALKELGVLRALDIELAHRFLREARMAGALSHPNVVTVHDYFEHSGTPFIAMEYVEGGSLRPHVGARLSMAQIGGVLDGLLAGLAHAEQVGIVHRDLKPENVLVSADGRVKITDFGIGKASDQVLTRASLTATGTTMGTPAYMAPEQALGDDVSAQTDLYAVGVIAFELLVGRTPFADTEAPMAILMRRVTETIPPVSSIRPDVDPRLSDWIDAMVANEPSERPRSAEVAREDLDEIMIAMLGARWRRDARLPVLAQSSSEAGSRTPSTRRISATMPWVDHDRTVPPRASAGMLAAAEVESPVGRERRRWPRAAIGAFAIVAVVAVLAAAAGRDAGPSASGPTSPAPSAREATGTTPLVPSGSSGSAPRRPSSAPAPAAPRELAAPAAPSTPTAPSTPAAPPAPAPAAPLTGENADDGGDDGGSGGGGSGENADDGGDGP